MAQSSDTVTARHYRLDVSMTRSESVALVVEESLDDFPWRAPFDHSSPAASTNPELPRSPMSRSHESSRKLLDRKRK